jgi:hypothetical protein
MSTGAVPRTIAAQTLREPEMKKRYVYALLFGAPGFVVALIISFAVFGTAAGILWIFVFGDNPWPASAEKLLSILFALTFLGIWMVFVVIGFIAGKRLEADPALNFKHVLVSVAATMVPVVLIVLHQLGVGNVGPKSASVLCSQYCSGKGYAASGMPPRDSGESACICFDERGREAVKVPLESIAASRKK